MKLKAPELFTPDDARREERKSAQSVVTFALIPISMSVDLLSGRAPTLMPCEVPRYLHLFHNNGRAHASSDTQRGESFLYVIAFPHFIKQRGEYAGA
jgi:hypothetical protein